MKISGSTLSVALALGAVLFTAGAMTPARAGLGQAVESVQADGVSLKGQVRARSETGYSVEEITTATGTVVREFVSPSGMVFAVSWSGPTVPDLQQTLGSYFAQYQAAVKTQRATGPRTGHHHLVVRSPSLVLHAGGHMRQHFGLAYVPSLVPPNLSIANLH